MRRQALEINGGRAFNIMSLDYFFRISAHEYRWPPAASVGVSRRPVICLPGANRPSSWEAALRHLFAFALSVSIAFSGAVALTAVTAAPPAACEACI
jgi:hypothetical protein